MPVVKKGGRKNRKYGRMLRKPAFKRYWSSFSKKSVHYNHRLEFNKVKTLMKSGRFDTIKQALAWWRENRQRHNNKG